jgi:ABC-type polar amino acid transport system ATPase subunit
MFYDGDCRVREINLLRELPILMLISAHDMKLMRELFPRAIFMDEENCGRWFKKNIGGQELLYVHGWSEKL